MNTFFFETFTIRTFTNFLTNWNFRLAIIRSGKDFSINAKIFVPLHSWELTLILIIGLDFLTQNWILGLTTGVSHMTHLIQDMRTYNVRFLGYSFISRSLNEFDQQSFCSS